jgi:hypothetical protein
MSSEDPGDIPDDQSMPRAPARSMSWRWNAKSTVAFAGTPPRRSSGVAGKWKLIGCSSESEGGTNMQYTQWYVAADTASKNATREKRAARRIANHVNEIGDHSRLSNHCGTCMGNTAAHVNINIANGVLSK